jgi:hypothetical protein
VTIVVGLERREVLDVLENPSAEATARWLGRHPAIEVVESRPLWSLRRGEPHRAHTCPAFGHGTMRGTASMQNLPIELDVLLALKSGRQSRPRRLRSPASSCQGTSPPVSDGTPSASQHRRNGNARRRKGGAPRHLCGVFSSPLTVAPAHVPLAQQGSHQRLTLIRLGDVEKVVRLQGRGFR